VVFFFLGKSYRLKQTQNFCESFVTRTYLDCDPQTFLKNFGAGMHNPIKLTTSIRFKLTTDFTGEDFIFQL
jgi:hypothetical protein